MPDNTTIPECSAQVAWDAVQADDAAHIVDVRTPQEWAAVGAPNLGNLSHKLHFVSWQLPPDMRVNADFIAELKAERIPANARLYFLCRSGVRSLAAAAAAAAAGYAHAVNVREGFEGVAGPDGIRHGGWRGAGLPEAPHRVGGDGQ
ncbi:MAG: rhodanese-like domain-containing protein [Alphaproteobacteria bacterium]|nr:rhodanese-like domain-containing protein [Alphaproteobacteria bacterium]MCB9928315.1 rhodanese-like domain-containing protein [Alphaproteobacteria bacterium]